jgi:hypothetical protein
LRIAVWTGDARDTRPNADMEALDYHVLMDKFTALAEFDASVLESSMH